jgi:hypothetical protein
MRYAFRAGACVLGLILATATASFGSEARFDEALSSPATSTMPAACCKMCTKGKACGNSCISRDKICHQPPGCACDG